MTPQTLAAADPGRTATLRAELRSEVTVAARVIPTHYPLETFIAVNPLAGLESMPFEQAIRRAGDLYGIAGALGEDTYRDLHRRGRITDADIESALRLRYPALLDGPAVRLGDRVLTPFQLLRADMLTGSPAPDAQRRSVTRAEQQAPQIAEQVDAQSAKWCAAYFGAPAAHWPMPGHRDGFYPAWRALAPGDHTLSRAVRRDLRALPARADDAALAALDRLRVDEDERTAYLQAHLTRLPGWAAHVRWSANHATGVTVLDYLAMRLTYESILLAHSDGRGRPGRAPEQRPQPEVPSARERSTALAGAWGLTALTEGDVAAAARVLSALPVASRHMVWQQAYEAHYRDGLLRCLAGGAPARTADRPQAQLVCCIDTRSEGLRRHLEALDGYETLGFAGFFAVAIRFSSMLGGAPNDLCPVLIRPEHDVRESPAPDAHRAARRLWLGSAIMAGAEEAFQSAKESLIAPFTLAEAAGWVAAPWAAAKTLTPSTSGRLRRSLRDRLAPPAATVLSINDTVPLSHRALYAQVALTTMGLTGGFARLVVLCGHGSTTENNPYQAALDCGACGGQAGGPNARTAAAILNDTEVRAELSGRGIAIGEDTWFLPAQHDTATDQVTMLDTHLVPATHRPDVLRLTGDLAAAGAGLAVERCASLPGGPAHPTPARAARHVAARSVDWAQVFPEWGLAGNAAFVVAPRDATRGLDLQRRAFLHSYDAAVDPDGSALETILTAPMVVAQWINCQYYFSAVAPETFGAGTKTIHNVVGGVGVLAGHGGDLQLGLPRQSIAAGPSLAHEPIRLMTVVQAPLERIDTVVERNPVLQQLFGNDWVALAAREGSGHPWRRWTRNGWRPWEAGTPDTDTDTDAGTDTDTRGDTIQEVLPCH